MTEPGQLDLAATRALHDHLMIESSMYREAHALGLVGLMASLQLAELESRDKSDPIRRYSTKLFPVDQAAAEDAIAQLIEKHQGWRGATDEAYGLANDILFTVLREFRPDLIEEAPREQTWSFTKFGWKLVDYIPPK